MAPGADAEVRRCRSRSKSQFSAHCRIFSVEHSRRNVKHRTHSGRFPLQFWPSIYATLRVTLRGYDFLSDPQKTQNAAKSRRMSALDWRRRPARTRDLRRDRPEGLSRGRWRSPATSSPESFLASRARRVRSSASRRRRDRLRSCAAVSPGAGRTASRRSPATPGASRSARRSW